MPNFPGSDNALPATYVETETYSSGLSIPSGVRLAAIIGEGARKEVLVSSAIGNGRDGLDSTYSGPNGADGRHFTLGAYPIISNRTTLYKNGIPLVGLEGTIDGSSFSSQYDYKIDISNGHIELQGASLVDQGGEYYSTNSLNTGNGAIGSLTLVDVNAPNETWTIRCSSVIRDGYGDPIDGYAKFVATGSVSGTLLDGYGNQIYWQSNGVVVSNGILSFAISEGATPFIEGDRFSIEVSSGVLEVDDSLTATYIAEADMNDPEFFTDLDELTKKHGTPSLSNRLSLGAQLSFANGTPGVYAVQAAPSIPRRVSYVLVESATGGSTVDDLSFPLPLGVTPDVDSSINFFITNPSTGIETQIIPNKVAFYNATITANPYTAFITNPGYTFSYTAVVEDAVVKQATDGILTDIGAGQTRLESATVKFGIDDESITRSVRIYESSPNDGTYTIVTVTDGNLIINSTLTDATNVKFEIIDSAESSVQVLFTDDLASQLPVGATLRATIVDEKDATFYDAGWTNAYESLEKISVSIIVPLPSQTMSVIFQNGANHVRYMSNIKNRKERLLFTGAIRGLTPENVIGTELAAVEDIGIIEGIQGDTVSEILSGNTEDLTNYGVQSAYGSTYRVCYFYPDEIVIQIGATNTLVDGFFIAAAAAGYLSGNPNVAIPLTKKVLSGFSILRNKIYRPVILEQLVASGITVLQPVTGGGVVLRGQTTTNSGFVEERELSIVFIRDRISEQLRNAFDGFIGQVDSPIFQSSLVARAKSVLVGMIGQGLITTFKDLRVQRDSSDPTQWNITVKVQPVYPVNFIYIKVSVGLL